MRSFKQLFCNHIWKDINKKLLRTRTEPTQLMSGLEVRMDWDYYSIVQQCVKCDFIKIIEKREQTPEERDKDKNTKPCIDCKGQGKTDNGERIDPMDIEYKICTTCEGRGTVPK
jgi:DnaJ-class molecular chaperone